MSKSIPILYELKKAVDIRCNCDITQEDRTLRQLITANESRLKDKLKWGEIADQLNQTGTHRTGKQCR